MFVCQCKKLPLRQTVILFLQHNPICTFVFCLFILRISLSPYFSFSPATLVPLPFVSLLMTLQAFRNYFLFTTMNSPIAILLCGRQVSKKMYHRSEDYFTHTCLRWLMCYLKCKIACMHVRSHEQLWMCLRYLCAFKWTVSRSTHTGKIFTLKFYKYIPNMICASICICMYGSVYSM